MFLLDGVEYPTLDYWHKIYASNMHKFFDILT